MQTEITVNSDVTRERDRKKGRERESRGYNSREGIRFEEGESDSDTEKV